MNHPHRLPHNHRPADNFEAEPPTERWRVGKKIPIALIITLLGGMAVQSVIMVWKGSNAFTRLQVLEVAQPATAQLATQTSTDVAVLKDRVQVVSDDVKEIKGDIKTLLQKLH